MAQHIITREIEHDGEGFYLTSSATFLVAAEWVEETYAPYGSTWVVAEPAGWSYVVTLMSVDGLPGLNLMNSRSILGDDAVKRIEDAVAGELAEKQQIE